MDTNNWRPTQPDGEPAMDSGDWRAQLQPDSRQRIVNKIMETLKRHLPFSGPEGINELRKIAVRFEEKIYAAATTQSDYLRKISMKMLAMETKSQNTLSNSLPSVSPGNGNKPPYLANQPQTRQQLLSQNIQKNIVSGGQSSAIVSSMPPVSGLSQNTIPSVVGQNNNMQNIAGISQNAM